MLAQRLTVIAAIVPACATAPEAFVPQTYLKASNPNTGDDFGRTVALSADGRTLAVAAYREDNPGRGIDPPEVTVGDPRIGNSGAVYVFVRSDAGWHQQAHIKASNSDPDDWFGRSVAISADGNTLAVGAPGEDSHSITDQNSAAAELSGAVYLFTRAGDGWSQIAYLKASSPVAGEGFGGSVALSGDGALVAVGAPGAIAGRGAVHVFTRSDTRWTPAPALRGSATEPTAGFGGSVALSLDGSTLAAGASRGADAVDMFARSGDTWSAQGRVLARGPGSSFGAALALSHDGSWLAIGAPDEPGATTDGGSSRAGAVHLFARHGASWGLEAHLAVADTETGDAFGLSLALSADGAHLAVGAPLDPRPGAEQLPDACPAGLGGTVHRFARAGAQWSARPSIRASNTCRDDQFGSAVVLSRDGSILAVGANGEDSAAHGVDPDPDDNDAPNAGAVYVLTY